MLLNIIKIIAQSLLLTTCLVCRGQNMVFSEPASVIFSESDGDDIMPTPLGNTDSLFFVRFLNPTSDKRRVTPSVLRTACVNGGWIQPEKAEKSWAKRGVRAVLRVPPPGNRVFLLRQNARRGWVKILLSCREQQRWLKPKLLFKYKKANWRSGAYVSDNGDTIIFPMRGKDSYGKEDLYVVTQDSSGRWSEAENLGPTINTSGSEVAPSIFQGKLFFASDGHPGFGGFDVFSAVQLYHSWKIWAAPRNLGQQINSSVDESSIAMRDGNVYFTRGQKAQRSIFHTTYQRDSSGVADSLPQLVALNKPNLSLLRKLLQSEDGYIFFEVNSDRLDRKDQELLFFVAQTLSARPDVAITVVGHADQEGDQNYNTNLSRKRAVSVREFLVSLGIKKERLRVVARGESDPLVLGLSEQAKRKNRRVQIKLTEENATINQTVN